LLSVLLAPAAGQAVGDIDARRPAHFFQELVSSNPGAGVCQRSCRVISSCLL
jgi:hypothetical protein